MLRTRPPVLPRAAGPPIGWRFPSTTSLALCEWYLWLYSVRKRSAGVGAGAGAGGSEASASSAKKIESRDVPICERSRVRASRRRAPAASA